MSKREREVKHVARATPVKTFLAHWGLFVTLLVVAQLNGYVVVYPKPVQFQQLTASATVEEEGGWLSWIAP